MSWHPLLLSQVAVTTVMMQVLDTASGLEILDNHDTHHGAAVQTVITSVAMLVIIVPRSSVMMLPIALPVKPVRAEDSRCYTCHTHDGGYSANDMRKCEECHGYESLHNILADSPDAGAPSP